jgi:cyclophilin family peptidyl-prolyl cis-trans isomerase
MVVDPGPWRGLRYPEPPMPNRARDRQLAKLAARRQEERRHAKRRRNLALGGGGAVLAAILLVVGFVILTRDDETAASASATTTPTATPSGKPGEPTTTGTVKPEVKPPSQVACGADPPAAAGEPKPQFSGPPLASFLKKNTDYSATLQTSCGTIELELDEKAAPQTVASFAFLARRGFFDGLTFHRVVPGFVIQAGDPLGSGGGGPGYAIADEYTGQERFGVGVLAMANASRPNSGGSQFFIVSGNDGRSLEQTPTYTVFGEVTDGLDVVKRIDGVPVGGDSGQSPQQAVYIEKVTIRERTVPSPSPSKTASASPNG